MTLPTSRSDTTHRPTHDRNRRRLLTGLAGGAAVLAGSGCERIQSLLAPKEAPLPGRRVEVLGAGDGYAALTRGAVQNPRVMLPPPEDNQFWTHTASSATHKAGHYALSQSPRLLWSARIGDGQGRRRRITSAPLIINTTIFVIDASGVVSARNLASGGAYWRRSILPQNEASGFGGGLAYSDRRVYATAGVDYLVCLDGRTGKVVWYQRLGAPVRSAPVVDNGQVYVVTLDNHLYALDAQSGALVWEQSHADSTTRLLGGSSLAVQSDLVVAALGTGEVQAYATARGRRRWEDTLAPLGVADSVLGEIADITAPPIVDGDRVYLTSQAGRTVAMDTATGRILWEASVGSRNWPSFAGKHMFLVTENARAMAIDIDSGAEIWVKDLPSYRYEPTRSGFFAWHGPLLAGGRLFIGGENKSVVVLNPVDGRALGSFKVSDSVLTSPVVANKTMLLLTSDGLMHAYR